MEQTTSAREAARHSEPLAHASRSVMRPGPMSWLERLAVAAALIIVFIALVNSYPHEFNGAPTFVSPRQQVTYELSRRWAETGRPTIQDDLLVALPQDARAALVPRDASSLGDEVIPKDFPITVTMYAATHFIASRLVPFVNPFFACMALLLFARLVVRVTGSRRAAWFATVLFAATTSFWMSAAAIVSGDSIGLCGLFVAIVALVDIADSRRSRWLPVLAGAGFALAISSRYTIAGPVAVLFAVFALRHRDRFMSFVAAGGIMVVGLLPVLAYHDWIYGGPLETGYGIADEVFKERVRFEGRGLTTVNVGRIVDHARYYLLRPEIAALLIAAVIAAVFVIRRAHGPLRTLAIAVPLISIPLIVYHGGQGLYGSVGFVTNSSFLRYLLPAFALWALLVGWLLDCIASRPSPVWRDRALLAAAVIAVVSMWTTIDADGGVRQLRQGVPYQSFLARVVLDRTSPDSLIITRTGSKVLWPQRHVLTATMLYDGPAISDDKILIWDVLPSPERLADVSGDLVDEGYDVYLYDDGDDPGWLTGKDIATLRAELARRDLRLRTVVRNEVPPLYHVVPAA